MDEILIEFPHLTSAQVYDALSFYYDHQDQIDQEIDELRDVSKAEQKFPATLKTTDDARTIR